MKEALCPHLSPIRYDHCRRCLQERLQIQRGEVLQLSACNRQLIQKNELLEKSELGQLQKRIDEAEKERDLALQAVDSVRMKLGFCWRNLRGGSAAAAWQMIQKLYVTLGGKV